MHARFSGLSHPKHLATNEALLVLPTVGNAALVTISGQGSADGDWNVTTVSGGSLPTGYTAQVWWGSATVAAAFAVALAGDLGYPNAGYDIAGPTGVTYAPLFGYETFVTSIGTGFGARTMQNGGGSVLFQEILGRRAYTWAVAERATTSPPPVPLPAAAWLLLSGLGGLGFMGRRRKAA